MKKESLLASMSKLILAVVLIVCVGAVMGLMGYALTKKVTENNYQRIKISNEDIEKETANWQIYKYEDWGFSIKIHPDYTKYEEKEIERLSTKLKVFVFSKNNEKITIVVDQSKDVEILRSAIFDAFKLESAEWEKSLECYSILGLEDSNSEFILKENIKKDNCVGIQLLEKTGTQYKQTLLLNSLNLEDAYITITFEYLNEKDESKILTMIETIRCTK